MPNPKFLYPYTVKHSPRARNVRLVVSSEGLVVVVPQRFCVARDLPRLLESKRDWIRTALEKVRLRTSLKEETLGLPEAVELQALGEVWRVEVAALAKERLIAEGATLTLTSDFNENEALAALRRWILLKGKHHLPPQLRGIAEQHGFQVGRIAVKEQKSLWGSCSSKGNINLNSRLLFLPPHLMRHVMMHELCHLREMNHSKAFHDLLSRFDSDIDAHAKELRHAWHKIPGWAL